MGRRKRRSDAGEDDRKSTGRTLEKGDGPNRSRSNPRRPNKWFLAAAVLAQAAWIAFLLVMALAG